MTAQTRRLGLDIAGLLAFGYDLRLQNDDENRFMLTVLDGGTFASSVFLHYPTAQKARFGYLMMLPLLKLREKYLNLIHKMITTRMAKTKDARHDLYSFVADVLDAGSGGLRQTGDTGKTAMSATFFYLSRNPEAYQKLADEIRSNFESGSEIRGAALASCHYLRACIDEALRMSPPAPGILWRELAPEESGDQPFIVDGHVIPDGTLVGVNTYSLHHNEEYFPNSFTYSPERWLDPSTTPEAKKLMRDAFAPFSTGPRGCAGRAMAYLQINLVVAKTLWYFDFEAAPGKVGEIGAGKPEMGTGRERPGEFQLEDIFGSSHDGPYLTFKPRGNIWKEIGEDNMEQK
ncbi:hypothetical protein DL764_010711 [Monosporascus ibericus]|uniref:Uncharacterized protein n=1 Tax=Monosporascus ibericus TaxID=155417 RepID=A0A4Q4STN6_9PEZI|nr:hypothetical protein DL764_010711 [Monosporascus ibericus]